VTDTGNADRGTLPRGAPRHGAVTEFDEHVGLGTIVDDDGVPYLFHCIEIADGSRTIAVGAVVSFSPMRKFGAWEAAGISP
jgi:cold shock CspA family protein